MEDPRYEDFAQMQAWLDKVRGSLNPLEYLLEEEDSKHAVLRRAEWLASMFRDECNCLNGTLDHMNCLAITRNITGEQLLQVLFTGIEEEPEWECTCTPLHNCEAHRA